MESNGHMDWLPGLGTQSHSFSNLASAPRANLETGLNTKAANGALDEVQYSIVCYDCGKHFWRRSTADSHAALTAHVLHEDVISPSSPVIVPSSPTISWDSAHRTKASLSSATDAETSVNTDVIDQGDTEDIGGEEYPVCFECGRYFSSYEAASNHARIGHMQDLEMILSSLPDGSPISTATNPAVTPTFPATASPHAIRGIAPTSPSWTTEHTSSRGFSPTSPNDSEDDFPTSTYEISSRTSDDAMALFQELYALPTTPNVSQRVCILTKKFRC